MRANLLVVVFVVVWLVFVLVCDKQRSMLVIGNATYTNYESASDKFIVAVLHVQNGK